MCVYIYIYVVFALLLYVLVLVCLGVLGDEAVFDRIVGDPAGFI